MTHSIDIMESLLSSLRLLLIPIERIYIETGLTQEFSRGLRIFKNLRVFIPGIFRGWIFFGDRVFSLYGISDQKATSASRAFCKNSLKTSNEKTIFCDFPKKKLYSDLVFDSESNGRSIRRVFDY